MTNYNKRLDEVLLNVAIRGAGKKQDDDYVSEARQALTSLIKELVAEAKPNKKPQFFCQGCGESEGRGHNQAINEFEQNLLKALEEV